MLEAADLAAKIERHLAHGSDWVDVREDRDNIDALVRQARMAADTPSASSWVAALLHFAGRGDAATISAVVLALHGLERHIPAPAVLEVIEANPGYARLRPTHAAIDEPDLRSALVVLLAGTRYQFDARVASFLERELMDGRIHAVILRQLARSNPALLIARASEWATTADTGTLFAFTSEDDRLAFARELAPWPPGSVEVVASAWAAKSWPAAHRGELLRAMTGGEDQPYIPGFGPLP